VSFHQQSGYLLGYHKPGKRAGRVRWRICAYDTFAGADMVGSEDNSQASKPEAGIRGAQLLEKIKVDGASAVGTTFAAQTRKGSKI